MAFVSVPHPKRSPLPLQVLSVLAGALILFLLTGTVISWGYERLFSGRIFPGISMTGVDLSNMSPEQAAAAVTQHLSYPDKGRIVFRYGEKTWQASPAELGMKFEVEASIQEAFGIGRGGGLLNNLASQLNAWQRGLEITPLITFNASSAERYIRSIAIEIDQPAMETDLHLDGTNVILTQGQTGRALNVESTLNSLIAQVSSFQDGEISLLVEEKKPQVADATQQADALRQMLGSALVLSVKDSQPGDPGPWSIEPALLANMISFNIIDVDGQKQYKVSADGQALVDYLQEIAPLMDLSAENARFYFDDNTRQLVLVKPAREGRKLDIAGTIARVNEKLAQGEHNVPLIIETTLPAVTSNATAESLGISGLVTNGVYTSYFRGSGAARLQNIEAAASRFYGLLIPPHTTFSMGDAIGDINLNNGYAEALIIYNGKTITGVGGGVCQVSTTLFRTAFFSGYPIVERHEHAYRVFYYEQTATGTDVNLAGMDATVYFPLVDLQFTNDRPYWLLMETYFNADNYSLTWKFYSGNDGRMVDVQNMGIRNLVPAPAPLFEENPDFSPGEIKQVDWSGDGADITVTRVVRLAGNELFSDAIQTHYEPWQAVCQYGPGTEGLEALAKTLGLCQH